MVTNHGVHITALFVFLHSCNQGALGMAVPYLCNNLSLASCPLSFGSQPCTYGRHQAMCIAQASIPRTRPLFLTFCCTSIGLRYAMQSRISDAIPTNHWTNLRVSVKETHPQPSLVPTTFESLPPEFLLSEFLSFHLYTPRPWKPLMFTLILVLWRSRTTRLDSKDCSRGVGHSRPIPTGFDTLGKVKMIVIDPFSVSFACFLV